MNPLIVAVNAGVSIVLLLLVGLSLDLFPQVSSCSLPNVQLHKQMYWSIAVNKCEAVCQSMTLFALD